MSEMMPIQEVLDLYPGVSRNRLDNMAKRGQFPEIERVGNGLWYVNREAFQRWREGITSSARAEIAANLRASLRQDDF